VSFSLRAKINFAMLLALLILATMGWFSFRESRRLAEKDRWVSHSREVLELCESLRIHFTDAGAARRAYVSEENPSEIRIFESASSAALGRFPALRKAVADNPSQEARLTELETAMRSRLLLFKQSIELHRGTANDKEGQEAIAVQGVNLAAHVNDQLRMFEDVERDLLQRQVSEAEASDRIATIVTECLGGSVFLFLIVAVWIVNRELLRSSRAEIALEQDISARKIVETHLVQMESRFRGLLEAAPDAMVVVDHSGEIILLNAQAENQFGYHRDELLGQKVERIIPEGFAERLLADGLRSKEDARAQQIGTGIELNGRRKDGTQFPIEIMLSPIESTEGVLVTAAIRDITMRRMAGEQLVQMVEELKRSNEELEQFAYVASHDLQEPLRMVASYTRLLSRRYKGKLDAEADEFMAFAADGAIRMQQLIRDLLAYSHVGKKGSDLRDTSSDEALQQALKSLQGAIAESGALITYDPLPTVLADEMQLTQLFQNLVGNAIKYQGSGVPKIHISAIRNGDQKWNFSVEDNGLGIDSKNFERIFGMFQRLHDREEFAGTGIGLAICKKIVERHGGSISVKSHLGEGSTFQFALAEGRTKSLRPLVERVSR
jgi:PAS domain S-box-containing protein